MPESNELVVPFLNDVPLFAYGVEIGLLYAQMRDRESIIDEITGYFCTENQEQITLMANRLNWQIEQMEQWDEGPEWTRIHMRRKESHEVAA